MQSLDNLKQLKIYNIGLLKENRINKLQKSSKNKLKNQAIIYISDNDNDIEKLFNNNLLAQNIFKAYYKPRSYKSKNNRIKYIHSLKDNYQHVKSISNTKLITKNNISGYNGINLIDDLSERWKTEVNSITTKSIINYRDTLFDLITDEINELKENGYTECSILISCNSAFSIREYNNVRLNHQSGAIINNVIRLGKKDYLSRLKDIPLVYFTDINLMYTLIDKTFISRVESNKTTFINSFNKLYKASYAIYEKSQFEPDSEESTNSSSEVQVKPKKSDNVEIKTDEVLNNLNKIGLTTDDEDKPLDKDLDETFKKLVKEKLSNDPVLMKMKDPSAILDTLISNDGEIADIINQYKEIKLIGKSNATQSKMSKVLTSKQDAVMNTEDIQKILKDAESSKIEVYEDDNLDIISEETKKETRINSFDKSYVKKQMKKDIIDSFTAFNDDPDSPLYVTKITESYEHYDKLNKLITYHVSMQSQDGKRHTITIDIPQVFDGKYIFLNGSKKIITKQFTSKPVVKVKPDEVYITTNYNKLNIQRFGSKYNEKLTNIQKILTDSEFDKMKKVSKKFNVKYGKSDDVNSGYLISLEYNNFSTYLLEVETKDVRLSFNQKVLKNIIENDNDLSSTEYDSNRYFPIGYTISPKKLLVSDYMKNTVYSVSKTGKLDEYSNDITMMLMDIIDENTNSRIDSLKTKSNPSLAYTRTYILGKHVPLIAILGFEKGLLNVLSMYGTKYTFSEKNKSYSLSDDKNKIKFKDGYLYYDSSKLGNVLLLSGLKQMNTSDYTIKQFNIVEPYLDFYDQQYGSRTISRGFHNAITFLLDPITKDVCAKLGLPTDIYNLLLYANDLLEGLTYHQPNDMNTYRIRTGEQIPALLYNILSKQYGEYKRTQAGSNPKPMSVPRDILVRKLTELQTVEEASELNPVFTADLEGKAGYKGLLGQNSDETYTPAIRAYSDSMKGILATSTPD